MAVHFQEQTSIGLKEVFQLKPGSPEMAPQLHEHSLYEQEQKVPTGFNKVSSDDGRAE